MFHFNISFFLFYELLNVLVIRLISAMTSGGSLEGLVVYLLNPLVSTKHPIQVDSNVRQCARQCAEFRAAIDLRISTLSIHRYTSEINDFVTVQQCAAVCDYAWGSVG
jgi:hypothetical protein